jgi:hypothetical protein
MITLIVISSKKERHKKPNNNYIMWQGAESKSLVFVLVIVGEHHQPTTLTHVFLQ